jgi:hypothetical protein
MTKGKKSSPGLFNLGLQSQYIILAGVLGVVITLSIYLSYSVMTSHYQSLVDNTRRTSEIRNNILQVRNHINVLANSIDLVMLQPEYKAQVLLVFHASFTEIDQILDTVIDQELFDSPEFFVELNQLSGNLSRLKESAYRLFEVRTNVNLQYPGMKISSDILRPARNTIVTTLNLALQEYDEDPPQPAVPAYRAHLANLKHLWTSTVAEYRLYLANRVGSFDEEQLYDQENHVDDYVEEMNSQISGLMQYREFFGFESEALLLKMPDVLADWKAGFARVKKIHHSDAWRKDSELMRVEILPIMEAVYSNLLIIGSHLQQTNSQLVSDFSRIGKLQTTGRTDEVLARGPGN